MTDTLHLSVINDSDSFDKIQQIWLNPDLSSDHRRHEILKIVYRIADIETKMGVTHSFEDRSAATTEVLSFVENFFEEQTK